VIRAVVFCVVLLVVGGFALLNWAAFAAPTTLSLGVTSVQAPLGLIMLGLVVFLCVLFAVWVISLQAGALLEARRQTRELQAQRDLADKAEASRFTELRSDLLARLNEHANASAAYFGQLEDRLERARVLPPESERPTPFDVPPR
jgi:type VI protein secretion system component VasK